MEGEEAGDKGSAPRLLHRPCRATRADLSRGPEDGPECQGNQTSLYDIKMSRKSLGLILTHEISS